MSLFDSASLVVTPNGYKEDKLYSIKPTDGSGDLVVTRATTATRVNSAGLVELVPYNLQSYSEDFSNAVWFKVNTTISSNSTTAPDGNTTADKLIPNTSTDNHAVVPSSLIINNSLATATIYAKAAGYNFIGLSDAVTGQAVFNLSNGTIVSQDSGITAATPINVGDGWYRLQINFNATTSRGIGIDIWSDASKTIFAGNGTSGIYVWGAQLVSGSSAKEYFPTTDKLNVPRLDYTNSTCPSILVEPQRTNLLSYSEQFDNAYWGKANMVINANATISPDGTNTADKVTSSLYPSTSIFKSQIVTAASHTLSCYVKADTLSSFRMEFVSSGYAAGTTCIYNLTTQATTITNYGSTTGSTATITSVGNGWYRCSLTVLSTATTYFTQLFPAGNGSLFLWGAQLEVGSYATSYIPTIASSVTRNADVISKTGISSLIGQTEGTVYIEVDIKNNLSNRIPIVLSSANPGTSTSEAYFFINGSGNLVYEFINAGIAQCSISAGAVQLGIQKLAFVYKNNDFAFYRNGVLVGTDTSGNIAGGLDRLFLGCFTNSTLQLNDRIKSAIVWKERLTNETLAQLTTI